MKPPPPQARQLPLLPHDAIVEILSWLPVKTLLQFTCVCRSWKSIISDPRFVKLHLLRSPRNVEILLTVEKLDNDNEDYVRAVPCSVRSLLSFPLSTISEDGFYPLEEEYRVIGSCNGLVCLTTPNWRSENSKDGPWFCFWNPATRVTSEKSPGLFTDFGPRFGFGYDNSSDTYKVVAVIVNPEAVDDSQKPQVRVYSMGDTHWRDIGSFPALPARGSELNENDGVYMSGTLNWFALRNSSLGYQLDVVSPHQLVIVSFDLGKETYKQLLLPDGLDEAPDVYVEPVLGVLMGCLCLSLDYKRSHFVLWQMKVFGVEKSWTQLVNVSYQHLQLSYPYNPEDHPLVPMCMSEDGHVVVLLNVEDLEVIMYNCKDKGVQRARMPASEAWVESKDYIQSLALPL